MATVSLKSFVEKEAYSPATEDFTICEVKTKGTRNIGKYDGYIRIDGDKVANYFFTSN